MSGRHAARARPRGGCQAASSIRQMSMREQREASTDETNAKPSDEKGLPRETGGHRPTSVLWPVLPRAKHTSKKMRYVFAILALLALVLGLAAVKYKQISSLIATSHAMEKAGPPAGSGGKHRRAGRTPGKRSIDAVGDVVAALRASRSATTRLESCRPSASNPGRSSARGRSSSSSTATSSARSSPPRRHGETSLRSTSAARARSSRATRWRGPSKTPTTRSYIVPLGPRRAPRADRAQDRPRSFLRQARNSPGQRGPVSESRHGHHPRSRRPTRSTSISRSRSNA